MKKVTSSMDEKKEKHIIRDSIDKKRNKSQKTQKDKKVKEEKKPQKVKSMPLTQSALSEMNKIYYNQRMNRVREWVNLDQEDCLYPLFC